MKIGTILLTFNLSGKIPFLRLKLKTWANGLAMAESIDFNKSKLIPSMSLLFLGSIDLRISQIRTGPISSKLNKGWSFLLDKYDSGFFLIFGMELAIF